MTSPRNASARRPVVALFDREPTARAAISALQDLGVAEQQVGMLPPGQQRGLSSSATGLLQQTAATSQTSDLTSVLLNLGVPEGEARFYADEVSGGRTLVVIDADGHSDAVRKLVLQRGGHDVQSRGGAFIRGASPTPTAAARTELPVDVTTTWQDFRSRYEMLWQQHYGTTDATWEQMEPLYRYAWNLANEPGYRGRPWSEVEPALQREYQSATPSVAVAWQDARGPMRDVWEDVLQEAATGAEGGADRRIPRQGTDQTVAARDVIPPRQGAA